MSSKTAHITPADGNVFADLGFSPAEAAELKAHSSALIAAKEAAAAIGGWIAKNGLKQAQAAEILGVSRPRVSDAVNGKTEKFTLDALFAMIVKTGKTPELHIR
ncbi:TPA: XRE family transcriptional regulator [Neisseria bacilliformis]|uniref:helix-turn-helix domain-containing protein n=1 Tax=Neisseria bacilliformis TaxID=267212 RepID=UPI0006667BB1|nr:XRE family transcriptional regulator [Neisseria bacilliformis]